MMDTYIVAMGDAMVTAQYSTCVRRKVGAVLLDHNNEKQGEAHNTERGGKDCATDCPRGKLTYVEMPAGSDYNNCIADHAEFNVMAEALNRMVPLPADEAEDAFLGWTMVVTCKPCDYCQLALNRAGISVVYAEELE